MKQNGIIWLPFLLFLPISIVVGIWMYENFDLLSRDENRLYFYFYLLFIFLPFFLVIYRPHKDFGRDVWDVIQRIGNIPQKWIYGLFLGGFSAMFLYIATIHISTYYERDRWILANEIPIIPIDMVIPARLTYFFTLFLPMDVSIPFTNLLFLTVWYMFLIYIGEKNGAPRLAIFLTFISTFLTGVLFITQYATFELPAAILSFIGLYGIWRGRTSLGLFCLIVGSVFKNTGVFFVATGGILLLILFWRERSFTKIFRTLDIPYVIFLAVFFLFNYWGIFYYITVLRGGPGYLLDPNVDQVFWISSFTTFIRVLALNYSLLFIFAIVGVLAGSQYRVWASVSLVALMFLRSLSKQADDGYAMMFIPTLSFFTLVGLSYIQNKISSRWGFSLFSLLVVGFCSYVFLNLLNGFPGGMHRLNSNFDQFIAKIARRFPEDGFIYERDISLKPYIRNNRGGDLDAIRFRSYPDDKDDFIQEMSQPGCKLLIAESRHLQIVGVSKEDLIAMEYSESPYTLMDESGVWVSFSKECNAWEYN